MGSAMVVIRTATLPFLATDILSPFLLKSPPFRKV